MDRNDFMDIVYDLLKDDPDNNRANSIIDAADEYAEDAAKEALIDKDTNVPSKSALDHIHNVVAENEYKRGYEQGKADMAHTIKDKTLFIKVSEEDVDRIKRVMLDCDPWCKTFYEDAPGEAHWIKKYTPDDGEIYECDHCGVEWQFNDGGPEENEAFFCPKCGYKMKMQERKSDAEVQDND